MKIRLEDYTWFMRMEKFCWFGVVVFNIGCQVVIVEVYFCEVSRFLLLFRDF